MNSLHAQVLSSAARQVHSNVDALLRSAATANIDQVWECAQLCGFRHLDFGVVEEHEFSCKGPVEQQAEVGSTRALKGALETQRARHNRKSSHGNIDMGTVTIHLEEDEL